MLDSVYIKGNQMNFFQQYVEYFIAPYITKKQITVSTKNGGVITNDGFLECIIFVQCTVYNARWRNNALHTML